jgi:hypothetical protein
MAEKILTQAGQSGKPTNDNQITQAWLQAKVNHYRAEVARLELELVHARASLAGHQIWLAAVQQRGER